MKIDKDELSIYDVEALHKDLLAECDQGDVTVDISSCNKIDMSVIQLFLSAKKSSQTYSKTFKVIGVNSEVAKIFKEAGYHTALGISNE